MNDKPQETPAPSDRRAFLKKSAAVAIGGVAGMFPVGAGLVFAFDPLRRKAGASTFQFVTSLNALAADGTPRRFPIIANLEDAWNRFPQVPVGAVYLRRVSETEVQALTVTCPHAGCPVEYQPGASSFLCPCHDSKFKLDGSLADSKSPSPRAMDSLEVQLRNGKEVWVRFQKFEAGKARKTALS